LPSIIKASQYGDVKNEGISAGNPANLPKASSGRVIKPDARDQHQAIVNDAFQKAKNIVDAAQNYSLNQLKESTMRMNEECAQMKIRSYEDGYIQGLAEGKKEGHELGYQQGLKIAEDEIREKNREASEKALNEINRMLETIENKKSEILDKFEADLGKLAVTIAQKIVKRELSTDDNTMQSIIQNVLESYRDQAWVKISVSPTTAELLTRADCTIAQALQEVSNSVKIVAMPEMNNGDCQIDLPDRLIDAGIDTQMNQIKAALL
jgi:flagellar biosynthesis/type III secretory pathway protein FliH